MNALPKLVFSRTLTASAWQNTTSSSSDLVAEMQRLKREGEGDLTILGSGSLVAQLAKAGLVDEFQLLVVPMVLGGGRTMFDGLPQAAAVADADAQLRQRQRLHRLRAARRERAARAHDRRRR